MLFSTYSFIRYFLILLTSFVHELAKVELIMEDTRLIIVLITNNGLSPIILQTILSLSLFFIMVVESKVL